MSNNMCDVAIFTLLLRPVNSSYLVPVSMTSTRGREYGISKGTTKIYSIDKLDLGCQIACQNGK